MLQVTKLDRVHFKLVHDRIVAKADELKKYLRKQVHEDVDPLVVLHTIFESEHAYIVNGYLVVYMITEMPWSMTTIIAEQLVFALEPTGGLADVIEFLEAKAKEAGAKYVCVGTALAKNDKALASVYEHQCGMSQMAINLYKEVT